MKKNLLIIGLMFIIAASWAQENSFTIGGGYVFSNIESTDADAEGWRITGLYEFNPNQGIFSHGFAVGFMSTTADYTSQTETSSYKTNSWPIYYAPKVTVGKGKLKGFVKGAIGTHISTFTRTGSLTELKSTDMGFYGGAGAGGLINVSDQLFITAEYEWGYMSNSFYRDGFVNSITGGIGFKF